MVRWWNVTDVTPSGLRLNRAWHIRQFLFALATPAATLVFLHFVSRWEEDLMKDRAIQAEAKAKAKAKASENAKVCSSHLPEQRTPVPPASSTDIAKNFVISFIPVQYKDTLTIDKLFMDRVRDFASAKEDGAEANLVVEAIREALRKAISPPRGSALDVKEDTQQPEEQKIKRISPMQQRREEKLQLKQQEQEHGGSAPAQPTKSS